MKFYGMQKQLDMIWVCLNMGYTWVYNRKSQQCNGDLPMDIGASYFQANFPGSFERRHPKSIPKQHQFIPKTTCLLFLTSGNPQDLGKIKWNIWQKIWLQPGESLRSADRAAACSPRISSLVRIFNQKKEVDLCIKIRYTSLCTILVHTLSLSIYIYKCLTIYVFAFLIESHCVTMDTFHRNRGATLVVDPAQPGWRPKISRI